MGDAGTGPCEAAGMCAANWCGQASGAPACPSTQTCP
jgi:hypothetical protein